MTKSKLLVFLMLFFCTTVHAAETKPSDKSISELLRVTESKKLLDTTIGQFDNYLKTAMQQALKDTILTEKEQKHIDAIQINMVALFKHEMAWEKLEPLFVQVYRDSFSQQEVDGMLAFYKSPSGQAVIRKMPVVMQNTMAEMQKIMGPVMQKVMKMAQDEAADIKATEPK